MFKKYTNRQLLLTLAALLLVYVVTLAFGGRSNTSFRKNLAQVDTAQVSEIIISLPENQGDVILKRDPVGWQVTRPDGKSFPAASSNVNSILRELNSIQADQLVDGKKANWEDYQLGEEGAVRVQAKGEAKTANADLYVGRSEFVQTSMMTYVRPADEDNVYLVKGYINSAFNKAADDWRDKSLVKGSSSQWSSLTYTYPGDSSFQMVKTPANTWVLLPDSTALEASKVNTLLSSLSGLKGSTFTDAQPAGSPLFRLDIMGSGQGVQLNAFPGDSTEVILQSSQNPGAYFTDGTLWKNIFIGSTSLLPETSQ